MADVKILGPEVLAKIDRLLDSCSKTREYLAKCKACQLDVDQEIAANEEQAQIAAALKREFFPKAK